MGDGIGPRTFDVPLDWTLSGIAHRLVPAGGRIDVTDAAASSAVHDTADGDLEAVGIVLSRTPGTDADWVLQVGDDTMRYPGVGHGVPAEIRDLLLGARAGDPLRSVRRVDTNRTIHRVVGPDGVEVGELDVVDERVSFGGAAAKVEQRRRVEVAGWDGPFVTAAVRRLAKAGAVEQAGARAPAHAATVGAAVHAYLREQHAAMVLADVGIRHGENRIHRFRVAIRRLRSALRVVHVVEPEPAAALDAELKWLSELLGAVRDREVLREHLAVGRDDEPRLDLTAAHGFVARTLDREEQTARAALAAAMSGRRYLALLRALREWRVAPPFTADADEPVNGLGRYVRAAHRDLDKKVRKADGVPTRLHRARKAAKRTRYVAAFAGPAAGKHGADTARHAKRLQRRLGDHQDCVMAASFLERVGLEAAGPAAFGCGVLWLREQRRAAVALE